MSGVETGTGPWALVAQVNDADADERALLAATLGELADVHRRWALLVTCHRVELYGFGPAPAMPKLRRLEGEVAVRHLFRVAGGMESTIVGETEILGQVRDTLGQAREGAVDERVARLLETAIAVGRATRAHPLPARGGLAERAVRWLAERAPLAGRPVLVVGTGVMGTALRDAMSAEGGQVAVASRRPAAAVLDLTNAARRAPEMAAVAVALRGEWAELSLARRLPPLADLSAPPAVPAGVRDALGADFLGIDELWQPGAGEAAWTAAAATAVEAGIAEYVGWLNGRDSVSTLVALRDRAESQRRARVERLLRRLPDLDERGQELVQAMSRQLVQDLLHEPLVALRSDPDGSRAEAARRLFGL